MQEKANKDVAVKQNVVLTILNKLNFTKIFRRQQQENQLDRHMRHLEGELMRKISILDRLGIEQDQPEDQHHEEVEEEVVFERELDWYFGLESDEEGDWWSRTRRRKNQAPMVERSVRGWERDQDEVSLKNFTVFTVFCTGNIYPQRCHIG